LIVNISGCGECAQKLHLPVGAVGVPRLIVCIDGAGQVEHGSAVYSVEKGNVLLMRAAIGRCIFRPHGAVNLLEIALPE
jgi:mannose-6-phosphate isomerase